MIELALKFTEPCAATTPVVSKISRIPPPVLMVLVPKSTPPALSLIVILPDSVVIVLLLKLTAPVPALNSI